MIRPDLIHHYEANTQKLQEIVKDLQQKLQILLEPQGLQIHSVTSRLKSFKSFEQKVSRPDKSYNDIWDVTDLLALRVTVYFEDSIAKIGKLIEKNLEIDFTHSENKLQSGDNQKFGYRSLHYVCHLGNGHPENARFEIQIRTVLQHAWAEIEHDLGYKTNEEIPGVMRRRFSQIASLLEIADREFVAIREDLFAYEEDMKKDDIDKLALDLISIKNLLHREDVIGLDSELSRELDLPLSEEAFYPDYLVRTLKASGLSTLGQVIKSLQKNKHLVSVFLKSYFEFTQNTWNFDRLSIETIKPGYGLLFIAHLNILANESLLIDKVNKLSSFYEKIDYPNEPLAAQAAAKSLVEVLKRNQLL